MSGTLYIVSTPIGNLKDITLRGLEVLKLSKYILAESSVRSSKLLNEYNINKKIITFNKDNEKKKINSITKDLSEGANICLISENLLSSPFVQIVVQSMDKSLRSQKLCIAL